ncbi:MAG: AcrR family transcriptional regulator [Granulosicoccus sp.]|jgi:AcrR family transcriptional regulator
MRTPSSRLDPVHKPQQVRSEQRVQQILDGAKAHILNSGCAALTMTDIARNAQISTSSIYQYFPNKEAIVTSLAQRYLDLHLAHTQAMLAVPMFVVSSIQRTLLTKLMHQLPNLCNTPVDNRRSKYNTETYSDLSMRYECG